MAQNNTQNKKPGKIARLEAQREEIRESQQALYKVREELEEYRECFSSIDYEYILRQIFKVESTLISLGWGEW